MALVSGARAFARRHVRLLGLRAAIDAAIQPADYYDDPNGTPAYKRHLTYYFAEQIRAELAA